MDRLLATSDVSSGGIMDKPSLPGEDHPEARAKTIDNLKRIGLAMGGDRKSVV